MAISISTHSVPIETKEDLTARQLFENIREEVGDENNDKFRLVEEKEESLIVTWRRERKNYTSRMNKNLDITEDAAQTVTIKNTYLIQLFPEHGNLVFSRDRTFKMRSVRNLLNELFEGEPPRVVGCEVSKDRMERLKKKAEDQGIRTTQVRLKEKDTDGAIELDKLTYSNLVDEIHTEIMENEDVHQEFLKLSYSDIINGSQANIKVLLYLNYDKQEYTNYISYNAKIDYTDKERNPQLAEDKFWAEKVYQFVVYEDKLPKNQKTFRRFSDD